MRDSSNGRQEIEQIKRLIIDEDPDCAITLCERSSRKLGFELTVAEARELITSVHGSSDDPKSR